MHQQLLSGYNDFFKRHAFVKKTKSALSHKNEKVWDDMTLSLNSQILKSKIKTKM